MKSRVIYGLLVLVIGCKQSNKSNRQTELEKPSINKVINVDTANIAILSIPKTKSVTCPLLNEKKTILTAGELQEAEEILLSSFATNLKHSDSSTIKHYKRQYVPYINDKGEKLIWVSCFCDAENYFSDWKTVIAETDVVMDGGSCYLTVTINLTKKIFEDFRTHGYA